MYIYIYIYIYIHIYIYIYTYINDVSLLLCHTQPFDMKQAVLQRTVRTPQV